MWGCQWTVIVKIQCHSGVLYIDSWWRGGFVLVQARTGKKKCFFNHIFITAYYYCLTSAPLSLSDLDVNIMAASSYSACLETIHHKQSEALYTAQMHKNIRAEVNIYIFWEPIKALWKSKFPSFFNKRHIYSILRDFINRSLFKEMDLVSSHLHYSV